VIAVEEFFPWVLLGAQSHRIEQNMLRNADTAAIGFGEYGYDRNFSFGPGFNS
jgi:hypothetical protein